MKNNSLIPFTTALLCLAGTLTQAKAETYVGYLTGTSDWNSSIWTPAGTPGAGDVVSNLSADATRILNATGSPTIRSLTMGTGGGTIQLRNKSNGSDSLTLTEHLTLNNGTLQLRGTTGAPGARLTVTTRDLSVGSTSGVGYLNIAPGSDTNVTFTVQGTTTLTARAAGNGILMGGSSGDPDGGPTNVDLGHLVFHDIVVPLNPTIGVTVTNADAELKVKSLRTTGAVYSSARVTGAGTLNIHGNAGDSSAPVGVARFESFITSGLSVRKTGTNTQILARSSGNDYSGGTEISGGVLAITNSVNNVSALGTGAVTILNGGALAASGAGTVRLGTGNSVTVESGGRIAPGAVGESEFSELRLGGAANGTAAILEMETGAEFDFRLGAGGESDVIVFTGYSGAGDLILNSTAVNISGDIGEGVYELFRFKSNESNSSSTGSLLDTSSGLTGGLVAGSGFDGFTAIFHYDDSLYGGIGTISMELQAIPEPGSIACLGLAGGVIAIALRRRQRAQV